MRGSGEFIVLQAPRDDTESEFVIEEQKPIEENQEIVLMEGRIKIWELPKSEINVTESPSDKIRSAVNGGTLDKSLSDNLDMIGEISKRGIIDWQACSKGKFPTFKQHSNSIMSSYRHHTLHII